MLGYQIFLVSYLFYWSFSHACSFIIKFGHDDHAYLVHNISKPIYKYSFPQTWASHHHITCHKVQFSILSSIGDCDSLFLLSLPLDHMNRLPGFQCILGLFDLTEQSHERHTCTQLLISHEVSPFKLYIVEVSS